ncbi:MAG: STAS domain-containing protein [Alphaproteobacteria bacterium]
MEYKTRDIQDGREIAINGRMTFADHNAMRDIIATFEAAGLKKIVFDLSGVEFIDSAALGMLLLARETAISRQAHVVLRGARDQARRIMAVAKFDKLFTVEA